MNTTIFVDNFNLKIMMFWHLFCAKVDKKKRNDSLVTRYTVHKYAIYKYFQESNDKLIDK